MEWVKLLGRWLTASMSDTTGVYGLINTSNLRNNLAIVQNDSFDRDNYFDNTCSREH